MVLPFVKSTSPNLLVVFFILVSYFLLLSVIDPVKLPMTGEVNKCSYIWTPILSLATSSDLEKGDSTRGGICSHRHLKNFADTMWSRVSQNILNVWCVFPFHILLQKFWDQNLEFIWILRGCAIFPFFLYNIWFSYSKIPKKLQTLSQEILRLIKWPNTDIQQKFKLFWKL